MNVEASFQWYRSQYAALPHQSIEAEGIWDYELFAASVGDPLTARANITGDITVPLATPVERLPYLNTSFYRHLVSGNTGVPVYYYSHLPDMVARQRPEVLSGLQPAVLRIAAERGQLVYECPDGRAEQTDQEVGELIAALGGTAAHQLIGGAPRHYHYTSRADLIAGGEATQPLSLYQLYRQGQDARQESRPGRVEVAERLAPELIGRVWQFYAPAHASLSETDPVQAGFSESELRQVLEDPAFTKLVYYTGHSLVNLSVVSDVRNCPWMNQHYYQSRYPDEYGGGRIVCGIGAITDPEAAKSFAPSIRTLGMIGSLVARAGGKSVFTFACDETSNRYIPHLTQRSMRDSGLDVDFSRDVGHQLYRSWQFGLDT